MSATGHLRPDSPGEARRRAVALSLPVLGVIALIATLPVGGAAIAAGSALFAATCIVGLLLAPRPARVADAVATVQAPIARAGDRAVDAVEPPPRALSMVPFIAIVWFTPTRVYPLPAPGPVKLDPSRLMVLLPAAALILGALSGARRIRTC